VDDGAAGLEAVARESDGAQAAAHLLTALKNAQLRSTEGAGVAGEEEGGGGVEDATADGESRLAAGRARRARDPRALGGESWLGGGGRAGGGILGGGCLPSGGILGGGVS
jgi:hypothetical protein